MASRRRADGAFRADAAFRRFLAARAVSLVGDGVTVVALMLHVSRGGSGTDVGLLLLASSAPRFFGPVAGAVADRFDQRRLMVGCDLCQALLVGLVALTSPALPVLLGLVAAASAFATVFGATGRGALPALVAPEGLVAANAWLGTARNVQVALGPVLGGALVAGVGVRGALAVDAATFCASALLLVGLPPLPSSREPDGDGFLATVGEGLAYAARHPVVRSVVLLLFAGVAFGALDNVALVFLAHRDLGAGDAGFGVASAAWGVGMVLASAALLRARALGDSTRALLLGWLLNGLGVVATAAAPTLVLAVAALAVGGAGNGLVNVALDTLLQQTVPRELLGRVGGGISAAVFSGEALASAVGGPLLDATSPRAAFALSGGGMLLVTAAFAVPILRSRPPAEGPVPPG